MSSFMSVWRSAEIAPYRPAPAPRMISAGDQNAPPFGDLAVGDNFQKHSYPLGIMVNANGERFVDEGADFRNWNDATASELLDRGRSELNPVKRKAIYVDFQKRMAETVPTIMLFSADLVTIGNDAVQNYQQHPSGWYYGLARAWLKK